MTALIEATHLRKTFGSTVAVDDLSMHVEEGQIYGLVGSDGAGKTTTIRLLVGALRPDSGQAAVCGFSIERQTEQARTHLGYLSQRFSLYEDLTVLENIRFFAELRGLTQRDWLPRSSEILDFVGLLPFKDRRAGQLSGGMKQKLGLASALVTRPRLLLLDEPTTGVDPVTRQDFWQLLIRIVSQEKVGVLITTPYMDEASRCQQVGFMRQGKIIAEGTPSELRTGLNGRILEVRGLSPADLRPVAEKMASVEDVRAFGDKVHLRVSAGKAGAVAKALEKAFPARRGTRFEARPIPATLEDVFIVLSGNGNS
ncbi:MAG TPA: ABC transporter ATP-binding protein [Anaerolineales bacterium]|nr:ABC transporter ATP-binding protein [Anaerolineales bacterium]